MPVSGKRGEDMSARHEPFREIIDRFGRLLHCQKDVREELGPLDIPASPSEKDLLSGVPIVHAVRPSLFVPSFRLSAARVWPVLGGIFPDLQETLDRLERILPEGEWLEQALRALMHADAGAIGLAAKQSGTAPELLLLCLRSAWAPVMAAARPALLNGISTELWRRPYCPVCGSEPDMAVLENHPDPSEFLVSKSGEVWHHCPACLHRWRFVRVACPACGNLDHKQLTRFAAPDAPREHIYACETCRRYLLCLDLVESGSRTDVDLAALELVHLDAVAQSRGYAPLSSAPWTALGMDRQES